MADILKGLLVGFMSLFPINDVTQERYNPSKVWSNPWSCCYKQRWHMPELHDPPIEAIFNTVVNN